MANTSKVLDNRATRIRKLSGLNRTAFCEKYGVVYRTYEYWERGFNNAPDYIMDLLEHVVRLEKGLPYTYRIVDTSDSEKVVMKSYMASVTAEKLKRMNAAEPDRYKLILSMD